MKVIKCNSRVEYPKSKAFIFNPINDLNNFNISTSYLKGVSPEIQNDQDKLMMVVEGDVQFTVNSQQTKMKPGDLIQILCGEKYQIQAGKGAKMIQLSTIPTSEGNIEVKDKIMAIACGRQSIRKFLDRSVSKKDIYYILKIGMFAPSGANRQPWKFIVISDPEIKRKVREGAEHVEKHFYQNLKEGKLKADLQSMGLSWQKPFLENAPFLICIYVDSSQPYYKESLWLATGWMLLAAEELGLSTLTYKPEDLSFLKKLINVEEQYSPELIIPIGYAAQSDTSSQSRKDLYEVVSWV